MRRNSLTWFLLFTFLFAGCRAQTSPTQVSNEVRSEMKGIPLYPGDNPVMDGVPGIDRHQEGHTVYSYIAQTNKSESIQDFYEENMPKTGWELFGNQEIEVKNRKSTILLFSKGNAIAEIELIPWSTSSYLVVIDLSNSFNNQQ